MQWRPHPPEQRWTTHAAVGVAGRLRLRAGILRATLRADLAVEPFPERRSAMAESGVAFAVRSPVAFVTVGLDLGIAMRPVR